MKADPATQLHLLDLQAVDTAAAQLAHRRRTLPDIAVVADREQQLRSLTDDIVRAQTEVGDLDREQRRLEADVDQVRQRSARDQQRLTSGAITSARELEGLQHEVQTLGRRQGNLEDQVLELMEQRESGDAALARLRAESAQVQEERDEAVRRRDDALTQIEVDLQGRRAERDRLVTDLPADLLASYERIRSTSGGTGAAALRQRRCEGCRLELAGSDLSRARNAVPDEVLRCEECGRILVRTPDSGL